MEENDALVVLTDEDGKDVEFDHLLTFEYEGTRYIALMPIDKVEGVEEGEVVLLQFENVNGEAVLKGIENPVLLDEVFNEFLDIMDEQEELDSQ